MSTRTPLTKSDVVVEPVGAEIWDALVIGHDFDCHRVDAEVGITQPNNDRDINDVISFHPDRIPDLINALFDLHMAWKLNGSEEA